MALQAQPANFNVANAPAIGKISGKVVDAKTNEPLAYSSLYIESLMDSTLNYATLIDDAGNFELTQIKIGAYKLVISFLGYKDYVIEKLLIIPPDKIDQKLGTLKVEEDSKVLEEVKIVAEKSVMQLQADKKVFNVDKSALSAGGTATDALKQIPTVDVDYQGNVSLRGSSNMQIFINGKPSGITGANKQAVLDAIPANAIESIEILNNPNAKFDAEGEAGIINIVLKKNYQSGLNGNVTVGYGTKYKTNFGVLLNFKKNKINFTVAYNFRFNETYWSGYNLRKNIYNDTSAYYLNTNDNGRQKHGYNNTANINVDYDISDNNSISFGVLFGSNIRKNNSTTYYNFLDNSGELYNYFERYENGKENDWNTDANIYYTKKFKTKNQNLVVSSNYSYANQSDKPQYQQQSFFTDKSINPLIPRIIENNIQKGLTHIFQFQTDYTHPFEKSKTQLEVGAKTTYRNITNDFYADSLNRITNIYEKNQGLINNFNFVENINAAYGVFSGAYKKFSYKTGLRMEQSNIYGKQQVGDLNFERHYVDFFPSVFLAQEFKKNHKLQLQYRRSINRPNTEALNPFGSQSDPYNIRIGNPAIQPVYTNALELSYVKNFKNIFLTTTVYYRQSKNPYTRYRNVDSNGVSILYFGNLDIGRNIGTEIILRAQITKWWSVMANPNLFYNALIGTIPNGEVDQNANNFTWNIRVMNSFKVWKNADIQLMWFYRGKVKFLQGELQPFTFVNLGFKKDFLKDNKASIAINISDIFHIQNFRVTSSGSNFDGSVKRMWESTIANIVFTYKFGKDVKPSTTKKKEDNASGVDGGGF
ncbi:MAG: TonB-dependent receptor [Sphingobacteriales bacterium]|jgi:outer membrane receptor protein involved in Fe transport|nr:MAG: TonB-dependent receptor [Sphingobacteriales bacterium]